MATYLQITPAFSGGGYETSIVVPEGRLTLLIRRHAVEFTLVQNNGTKLSRFFFHYEDGAVTPDDKDSGRRHPNAPPRITENEFNRRWRNDPAKLAQGLVLINIYDKTEQSMDNVNEKDNLHVKVGERARYTPFPTELPDFWVALNLVII